MKLVIEIDPRNDYEIIDAIETLKALPTYRDHEDGRRVPDLLAVRDRNAAYVEAAADPVFAAEMNALSPAPAPAPAADATEADAIAAMQDLVKRHGAEGFAKAREVLNEFGAARVTELKAEQRVAFIEKAKAA